MRSSGRNIRLQIEYDGTNYCGWQVQRSQKKKSIQEIIEKALSQILQEKIKIIVCGRTDSGVHAKAQVANFRTNSNILLNKLVLSINALLPEDISVYNAEESPEVFHSRFSAKSKIYRYTILNSYFRSALLRNYVYSCPYPLDIKLMRAEAKTIIGKHNFKAFEASGGKLRNPVKHIKKIKINKEEDLIHIDIEADGFLYNMVRNIVGTLIEIGRGRFPKGSFKRILNSKNRKLAGPTAPAKGLCLLKVKY